jgi:hypothetical protein
LYQEVITKQRLKGVLEENITLGEEIRKLICF